MFAAASCEPTLPKPTYSKREPASLVNHSNIDTTTLINNASASTIDSPALENTSTRPPSSTIMTGKGRYDANIFLFCPYFILFLFNFLLII